MQTQFDTIYHEHFSYLSLHSAIALFEASGLRIWKVELLSTHGGSLRVFGCHMSDSRPTQDSVAITLDAEKAGGLREISTYLHFQSEVNRIKDSLLIFLIEQKKWSPIGRLWSCRKREHVAKLCWCQARLNTLCR